MMEPIRLEGYVLDLQEIGEYRFNQDVAEGKITEYDFEQMILECRHFFKMEVDDIIIKVAHETGVTSPKIPKEYWFAFLKPIMMLWHQRGMDRN